jgi:large subunit ribosomal protein L2
MSKRKTTAVTPGQRHLYLIDRSSLSKEKPLSYRTKGLSKSGGRNNRGRVTVRHRGGGHKRKYRSLDFKGVYDKASVEAIEADPNRSAWIARLRGRGFPAKRYYILAPQHLTVGGPWLSTHPKAPPQIGNRLPLGEMPLGTTLHNVEIKVGKGGQLIRSAGSSGLLIHKGEGKARIRLPSGLQPSLSLDCKGSIGSLGNRDFQNQNLAKAGRNRWLGKRPKVRGVAMNPIDHPHGGGEGRSSGGRPSVTPWGRPTKGPTTRSKRAQKGGLSKTSFTLF